MSTDLIEVSTQHRSRLGPLWSVLVLLALTACGAEGSAGDRSADDVPLIGTRWRLTMIEGTNRIFQSPGPSVEAVVDPQGVAPTFRLIAPFGDDYLAEVKSGCGDCVGRCTLEGAEQISMPGFEFYGHVLHFGPMADVPD